ncbi:MAG: aminodeoxychorismate/anthranilate synthase component II [Cryomorphaceae bacterium]|nr:aminodeoxychorismate/anthranilate synthase component II [Cryomorphaceae bacterium]
MAILLFDNHDSFTYNLQHYLEAEGQRVEVVKNDGFIPEKALEYSHLIISPGPGLPAESGCLMDLLAVAYGRIPMLGVCMGMQAMAEHCGFSLYNMSIPMHGISRNIRHLGTALFGGIKNPTSVGLYHSWAVGEAKKSGWVFSAHTEEGVVMAMENAEKRAYGVQFHPESIMTEDGRQLIRNFLHIV